MTSAMIEAIGPSVELSSSFRKIRVRAPFSLALTSRGKPRGRVSLEPLPDPGRACIRMRIERNGPRLDSARQVEAVRMFALLCLAQLAEPTELHVAKTGLTERAFGALANLGFEEDSGFMALVDPSRLVGMKGKARDMNALYENLFAVPWNLFSPCDLDVLQPLFEIPRRSRARKRVLDLGCGLGKNARVLSHLGYETYGVDISPHAIRRARSLTTHPSRFVASSATAMPWPAEYFDFVLDVGCLHCMGSTGNMRRAVAEVQRVMKKGATLYSRIFLPRDEEFVRRAPFRARSIGMATEQARALFTGALECTVTVRGSSSYFTCRRSVD